jgi:hypothetical protein
VCEVNFQMTFWEPLWFPSSLVISQSVNEQWSGMLPYTQKWSECGQSVQCAAVANLI